LFGYFHSEAFCQLCAENLIRFDAWQRRITSVMTGGSAMLLLALMVLQFKSKNRREAENACHHEPVMRSTESLIAFWCSGSVKGRIKLDTRVQTARTVGA